MDEIEEVIKKKVKDIEDKINKTKKMIQIAKVSGIDTTEHEIRINDIEKKIKEIKKILG